ncbi:MAG: ParB/RepB/Spo0J family partition protein [Candidatus Marinimicrobia bacterium]|jgi:ParB family chromosome partitioning protein|nr:ParB/RepB/Spo0J family partition protein [Candidatus Neomarinimicrobiota bacterium]MBT3676997.1 ParB/RepB/Spo0J family partition protein [Candidatus Neomarinimicrobiota bacterium]MBT3762491.1 ParB/RepB/Spo0J family partition protein [Candidatus Neomarinimicrobiota bacterium]MBT4068945.1 ParB/RepB/Spo0J family partition protein [Candidatus Neomarinimicrobiota bacterium]MBT4271373.1 ParB/RepB/Spo0J family partition protein [Candidatus Neomarinimicrobiota bacterium]
MATNRLGKGIDALIRPPEKQDISPAGVTTIPISKIKANPHQPRKHFDNKALDELAASIKEKGVITPITVRADDNGYILIAGERRLRASKLVKRKQIPAYIIEVTSESEMMEVALIENIQRENLNPLEEAEAYAVLQGEFSLVQTDIAKAVGKSRSTVTNSLRLLQLPSEIKKSLRENKISAGHGRAILAMKTQSGMRNLWQMILSHDLSVRGAEAIVKGKADSKSKPKKSKLKSKNATVRQLESEIISILGTKVRLNHKGKKGGSIVVDYFSADDLERILDLLRSIE